MKKHNERNLIVILYNLRSVHNVGSILRTADGAGVETIYLVGTTPTPIDRFNRKRKDMEKVALGAEEMVTWEHRKSIDGLVSELHQNDIEIVALEQHKSSIPYTQYYPHTRAAVVVGEETVGIPSHVIEQCDMVIEIPMYGTKKSLNVSVGTAIALYHLAIS